VGPLGEGWDPERPGRDQALTTVDADGECPESGGITRRLKGGLSVEQAIGGGELRAFRRYFASREDSLPWLFISERGQPLTRQSVNYLIAAAARDGLSPVHPHTLRHLCGFALADKGYDLRLIQDYLGHRDPRHTVHYTRVAGPRFEGLWR
jgi:type 1 fimbriae regulatory protein FimB